MGKAQPCAQHQQDSRDGSAGHESLLRWEGADYARKTGGDKTTRKTDPAQDVRPAGLATLRAMFSSLDLFLHQLRRHGQWLLALSLALALLQVATLARSAPHGGDGALAQICTSQGLITINANGEPVTAGAPSGSETGHGCCGDCAPGAPLLPPSAEFAVSPAPTCALVVARAPAPRITRAPYRTPPSRAPPSA